MLRGRRQLTPGKARAKIYQSRAPPVTVAKVGKNDRIHTSKTSAVFDPVRVHIAVDESG